MAVLHSLRPESLAHAITLLARQQGYRRTEIADEHGKSFDLKGLLDAWQPSWSTESPAPGMGANSQMLRAFTYCVFVGVWEDDIRFMLNHPDALGPKCVRLSFLMKDGYEGPRALLTVHAAAMGVRAFVPFPPIPAVLVAAPNTGRFVDSHAALRRLIATMIERVNLVTPAALLMSSGGEPEADQ